MDVCGSGGGPRAWPPPTSGRWLAPAASVGIVVASLAVVAGHVATFVVAARTVGVRLEVVELVPVALLVLVVAAVPLNLAGWGPREGAAAWAFAAAGLGAAQGLAVAVAYGTIVLVATLPGAVLLLVGRSRRRPVPDARRARAGSPTRAPRLPRTSWEARRMAERPYTVLSWAMSLDGYLDDVSGRRLVLSNAADLDRVDAVRASCDAILVGAGTVRADNPRLVVRRADRRARRVAEGRAPSPRKVTVTRHPHLDPSGGLLLDRGLRQARLLRHPGGGPDAVAPR